MQNILNNTTAWEQGAVVVNARRDTQHIAERIDVHANSVFRGKVNQLYPDSPMHGSDIFSIISGEPVLMLKEPVSMATFYRDTNYSCISSLNGAFVNNYSGLTKNEDNYKQFMNDWAFAGFARNDAMYDDNDSTRDQTMFACLIGGIKTTYNTGDKQIFAGQHIIWDIPTPGTRNLRKHIDGINDDKILPMLVPFSKTFAEFKEHTKKLGYKNEKDPKALFESFKDLSSRVVGVALSPANPGEKFDIKIGSYCL